jgi:hypothetical protein
LSFELDWWRVDANEKRNGTVMGTKTRTETIVEKHQRMIIHSRRQVVIAWCEQCRLETLMLSPEKAAALVQTTAQQ